MHVYTATTVKDYCSAEDDKFKTAASAAKLIVNVLPNWSESINRRGGGEEKIFIYLITKP